MIRYDEDGTVYCEVCGEAILTDDVLPEGRESADYREAIRRVVQAIKAHTPVHSRAELEAYREVMIAEARIAQDP